MSNSSDEQSIYYNCSIENQIDGVDNSASERTTLEIQTNTILEKQSDYKFAVASWNIRSYLPVFIATIQQGTNTDRNLMPFSVCFEYLGNDYKTDLIWEPDVKWISQTPLPKPPSQNNGIQDLNSSPFYYYCNTYQKFVDIINTALRTSYNAFNAAHPGIHAEAPHVQYDARTGLFALIGEFDYATGANRALVYVDALLYKYLDTIRANFYGYNNVNGKDYLMTFAQYPGGSNAWSYGNHYSGATPFAQTTPPTHIIMEQESDTRYLWSNIKQILITSASINVREEYMPFRSFPQEIQQRTQNRFNQPKESVLSYIDYGYASPNTFGVGATSSLHRDIFYEPKFYKWIDLVGDAPLNNINIQAYFITEDGFKLNCQIPNKSSSNFKFVFRKR